MYRNILVPVAFDHSEKSTGALEVAKALAAPDARIVLFHVLDQIPAFVASQIPGDVVDQGKDKVRAELEATARHAGPGVELVITQGHASRAILDHAHGNGVDCIVISSHRPGLEDYFLGSTAARVVRHAQCAVHVIR